MNPKARIVLDTNVFLVALAKNYKYHWIFEAIIQEKFDLYVSNEILTEYQEVIAKRYGLNHTDATLDFLLLLPNVHLITPYFKWNLIAKDEDDNKFVDCAFAANADYIITNDKHFQVLKHIDFPKVETLSAAAFTEQFYDL